jgi:hypothetical protein
VQERPDWLTKPRGSLPARTDRHRLLLARGTADWSRPKRRYSFLRDHGITAEGAHTRRTTHQMVENPSRRRGDHRALPAVHRSHHHRYGRESYVDSAAASSSENSVWDAKLFAVRDDL